MRLLAAIQEKTGGRSRAVRDVVELQTGLSPDAAREAWRELLALGLIERFSMEFAARLSFKGVDFIAAGQHLIPEPAPLRKVLIMRGEGTAAREELVHFVTASDCEVTFVPSGATLMQHLEQHADVAYAVALLTPADLGISALMDLGCLIGRLGSLRVRAFSVGEHAALPQDLGGVAVHAFDPHGDWKAALTALLTG